MQALEDFKQVSSFEPDSRFVFWSGGHDSTVALHLALRAWKDPQVVFVDTKITLPETLQYIEEVAELWSLNLVRLEPEIDFWQYVAYAGFPMVKYLWCRRLLKMKPIKKFYEGKRGWKVQVLGIRRAESRQRASSPFYRRKLLRHTKLKFTYNFLPILDWDHSQIKAYMEKFKIPLNPCYSFYRTSGCYFCPFVQNKKHYLALKRRHPDLFQKIVNAEQILRTGHSSLWSHKCIYLKELAKQSFIDDFL